MSLKLFTVEEANALIPRLEIVMGRLQRNGSALREAVRALATEAGENPDDLTTDRILELRPELRPLLNEMKDLLAEITKYDVQFKGLELGLIDFPTEMDGEIVLLCWQYGEKQIEHYHTIEAGFSGRKPLYGRPAAPRYLQ